MLLDCLDLKGLGRKLQGANPLFLFDTDRLVDCLRDFGPADLQLACLICKTLWNYSENITSAASCFGEETDTLLMLLTSLLGEIHIVDVFSLIRNRRSKIKMVLFEWKICHASVSGLANMGCPATRWFTDIQHIP